MDEKRKGVLLSLTFLVIFIAGMSYFAYGLGESATTTINEHNPKIYAVEITNVANTANQTAIDPEVEYRIQFNATDNNSIDDINKIKVVVYFSRNANYRSTTNTTRALYTFTWTENAAGTTGTWASALGTSYIDEPDASTSPTNTSAVKSYWFDLYFQLNGSAIPTGATNKWAVEVYAYDDDLGDTANYTTIYFDVNKYNALSTAEDTINYGTLNPNPGGGSTIKLDDDSITFSVHSNTQINLTVAGKNLTNAYTGTGGAGGEASDWKIFATDCWMVNTTTLGGQGNTTFDETAQLIYRSYNLTGDSLDTAGSITGYNNLVDMPVNFGGAALSIIKDLIYTATYTVSLVQGVTPT